MKNIFILLCFVLFSISASAETIIFRNYAVKALTNWEAKPSLPSKEAIMRVQFEDERGLPVEIDSEFSVELFMPQMGHGSGPTALERVLDIHDDVIPGLYRVKNMWFIMNGVWEVRMMMGSGSKAETQVFNVSL
jgi:hypothetical protein